MEEQWKDIFYYDYTKGEWIDYRGLYAVSSEGNVKSFKFGKEKILSPQKTRDYLFVKLCKNGKKKQFKVHRLVAFLFIENDDQINKIEVNHIDENKINNSVSNLEWVTSKANCNHGTRNKRVSESNKGKQLSEEHKQKLSLAHKSNGHPMYGKHHSDETKRKMRKAQGRKIIGYSLIDTNVIILQSIQQSKLFGFDSGAICNCCNGKRKSHKGFKWFYLDANKLDVEED